MTATSEIDPLAWLAEPVEHTAYPDARVLLERRHLVVPILGAGISAGAGQPTSPELAAYMLAWAEAADLPQEGYAHDDARSVANVFLSTETLGADEIRTRVVEYIRTKGGEPTAALDALVTVPSLLIVTLNYDLSVEEAAARANVPYTSLVLRQHPTEVLQALGARGTRDRLVVLHLHGSVDSPLDIILDSMSYSELANFGHYPRVLHLLLNNFTLLFMGTRLDEQLIVHELLGNRAGQMPHLFVGDRKACEELTKGRMAVTEASHLVVIRAYPNENGKHDALIPLAEYLAAPIPAVSVPTDPRAALATVFEELRYVRPTLIPQTGRDEDSYLAFLVAAGERAALDEDAIRAVGARTLLVGAPGSGKTTLMREVGRGHDPDVRPLLIRLADVGVVGDPARLLEQWATRGEGLRQEEAVAPAALKQHIFHFFLDGLDEAPRARQEALADKIVQIARAHPMHMFTVASRPVPALDRFTRPEWQHVAITPGPDWQREYLEKWNLTWAELRNELPLLDDLRELLQLPFFLDAVVRLHKEKELAGAHDLLDLVGRLVDVALAAAGLPIPAEETRAWLRRVALAMHLAERTELAVSELATVPMEARLAEAGEPVDIAETLVSARLLDPRGDDRYGFIHRIVGEALVAEELAQHAPTDHNLIDVIAPRVSDRVVGVRNDWLVPVTLVGARDRRWREAVAERDPLAGARTVPDDAPLEERLEAAQQIWSTYTEWRVWIWDYQTPSLVEDADVLARLLRTEGLDELRGEILAAAGNERREIRGNAFRVLSLIGAREIESHLRAVIEDPREEPVLRRVAAGAAVRLGLNSLFYLIAHRALNAGDGPEGQDMTYYALDLAGEDELLPFVLRLATAPSGTAYIAMSAVERKLTPRDQLRFLHAWATRRDRELDSITRRVVELVPHLPAEHEVARQLGFVAGAWRLTDDVVREYLTRSPREAAAGLVQAAASGVAYDYELLEFLSWFSLADFEAAGAPQLVLDWKRREEEE